MPALLGIGELARLSGLTVSALRFYDREGVLVPAVVDPDTGYRRYAVAQLRPARLVAGMRRIGVPLADLAVAVEQLERDGDLESVRGILVDHVARLEEGLAAARREVDRLAQLLVETPAPASGEWVLDGPAFVRALAAVRFAVGADPDFPVLAGVLLEIDAADCRVVATDRYRLAVSLAPVRSASSRAVARVVAPVDWVDAVLALRPDHDVRLGLDDTHLRLAPAAGPPVVAEIVQGDYPDHRRVVEHLDLDVHPDVDRRSGRDLDAAGLAAAVRAGATRHTGEDGAPLVVLGVRDTRLVVDERDEPDERDERELGVAVRREFLLEALAAAGEAAVLRLDGPVAPLVIRRDEQTYSVLMPVRRPV